MDVANVLLQIFGDSDDARRDLQRTAAELAAFDRIDAEAEADVEIDPAQRRIRQLKAELAALARQRVEIDVDVDRTLTSYLSELTTGLQGLAPAAGGAGGGIGGLRTSIGGIAGGLGAAAAAAAALIPVFVALGAAAVALAASLAAATAGALALGVAAGALLLPAIGLAVGAIQRFKEQADQAGTPANRLQSAAQQLAQTFGRVLAPAADAVFGGLASAMRAITPMLGRLKPEFTAFGQAVGNAFRTIGRELASPAWERFFSMLLRAAAQAVGPLTSAFISFARILRDIATAAMPFLIRGLQSLARWLRGVAESTSDIGSLRQGIGGLVDHLRSWWNLAGQLGRVFVGVLKAAAGPGKDLVDTLARGAEQLANWVNSAEGQERIRQFFERVLPLAEQVLGLAWDLTIAFLRFGEATAPGMTAFVEKVRTVVQALGDLAGAASAVGDVIGDAFSGQNIASLFTGLPGVASAIGQSVGRRLGTAIAGALRAAGGAVGSAAQAIWARVRAILTRAVRFVISLPGNLVAVASRIWAGVRGAVTRAIRFVMSLPGNLPGLASRIWSSVRSIVTKAINFVISLPGVGGLVSAARAIWNAINSALPDITINIDIPTPSIPDIDIPGGSLHPLDRAGAVISKVLVEGLLKNPVVVPAPVVEMGPSLRALSGAVARPAMSITNNVTPIADGGSPDPNVLVGQLDAALRARGGFR